MIDCDDGKPLSPEVEDSLPAFEVTGIVVVQVVELLTITVTVRETEVSEGVEVEFVHLPLPLALSEVLDRMMPDRPEVTGADGRGTTVIVTMLSVGSTVMTVVLVTDCLEADTTDWVVPLMVNKRDVLTPVPDEPVTIVAFEGTGKSGVLDFVIFEVMVGKPEDPPETVAFEGVGKRGVLVLVSVLFEVVGRTNEDREPVKLVPTVIVEVRILVLGTPVPVESQDAVEFEGKGKRGVLVLVRILDEVIGRPDRVPVPVKLVPVGEVGELVTGIVMPPGRLRVALNVPGRGVTETPVPVPDVRPKIVVFDGIGGRLVWIVTFGFVPVPGGTKVMFEGTGNGGVTVPEGRPGRPGRPAGTSVLESLEPVVGKSLEIALTVVGRGELVKVNELG